MNVFVAYIRALDIVRERVAVVVAGCREFEKGSLPVVVGGAVADIEVLGIDHGHPFVYQLPWREVDAFLVSEGVGYEVACDLD